MTRPAIFIPRPAYSAPKSKGALDFLQSDGKLSALLPAANRLIALQQDCAVVLPTMFTDCCAVLNLQAGQLVVAAPSSAIAARLKQQLPKLQAALQQRGWPIDTVRLKLQVVLPAEPPRAPKQAALPATAIKSFATLAETLDDSPRNQALKAALGTLMQHHRDVRDR